MAFDALPCWAVIIPVSHAPPSLSPFLLFRLSLLDDATTKVVDKPRRSRRFWPLCLSNSTITPISFDCLQLLCMTARNNLSFSYFEPLSYLTKSSFGSNAFQTLPSVSLKHVDNENKRHHITNRSSLPSTLSTLLKVSGSHARVTPLQSKSRTLWQMFARNNNNRLELAVEAGDVGSISSISGLSDHFYGSTVPSVQTPWSWNLSTATVNRSHESPIWFLDSAINLASSPNHSLAPILSSTCSRQSHSVNAFARWSSHTDTCTQRYISALSVPRSISLRDVYKKDKL